MNNSDQTYRTIVVQSDLNRMSLDGNYLLASLQFHLENYHLASAIQLKTLPANAESVFPCLSLTLWIGVAVNLLRSVNQGHDIDSLSLRFPESAHIGGNWDGK